MIGHFLQFADQILIDVARLSDLGRGLARAVTTAAIDTARSWRGVTVIGLSVSASAPEAIALYESLGFERWGVEPDAVRIDGVSHAEVHMALDLSRTPSV